MSRYREACEALLLGDYEYALAHNFETQLWDVHTFVNNAFRKELSPVCLCEIACTCIYRASNTACYS